MRTTNSIRNSIVSAFCYGLIMLGAFATRGIFARALGEQLVGVESVFLSIVNMLAIVELGIGAGVIYKLYQPIVDNDDHKIAVLLNFFKGAYVKIAWLIGGLGVLAAFFAPLFVTNGDFGRLWLSFVFLFYVADVLSSYLYAHKRALFMADQKNYILVLYHTLAQVAMCILQAIVLLVFHSFLAYLVLKILCRILENLLISRHYNKYYAHIDLTTQDQLPEGERKDLFANIKAMLFHKIGGFTMTSSAQIVSSVFKGVATAGYYSNYTMLTNGIVTLAIHFFDGIVASFGDLVVSADRQRVNASFNAIYYVNYLIISFCSVSLFVLGKPFVLMWIGSEDAVFPLGTIALICLLFFINGMRQSVLMVRNSAGIYRPDQYFPILEAAINIFGSIAFVQLWGINGIVFANILSLVCVPFWTQPIIVHKYVLQRSPVGYYLQYLVYLLVTLALAGATYFLADWLVPFSGFLEIFCKALLCLVVPNLCNLLIFSHTRQGKYIWDLFRNLFLNRLLHRK